MNYFVNGHNIFLIISICFIASLVFVQIMKRVAIFLNIMDRPVGNRKIQTSPVPLLGGLGIYLAFLLGYMLFAPKNNLMLSVLIGSFLLLLLGLFDDMTKCDTPMPNKYKWIVQIIVSAIVVFYGGLQLNSINIFGWVVNFGIFAPFITMLIILGITNAINLIDGLDGLCAGISAIYFLTIAIIGFILNKFGGLDIILCLIMLGSTLGYLVHNFPPATIYQGDTGSTFLGFMIAIICLLGFKTTTVTSLVVPVFILAIPILDTFFAIVRRKLRGQRLDHADKDHIHHQLLKKKLSKKSSLFVIYGINLVFSATTIFYVLNQTIEVIACYIFFIFILIFLIFKTDIIFERGNKKEK